MAKFSVEKWESFVNGVTLNIEMTGVCKTKIEVADHHGRIDKSTIESLRAVADEMESINKDIKNKES